MMSGHTSTRKRLVASFLQFLNDEIESEGIDSEMAESIDVARQCLRMAYTTTAEDVPASQSNLIDIFRKYCPPPPERKPLTDREIDHAESLKKQGNDHMKDEEFDKAIECYSKAIAIDGANAVYYCNRAAAHTGKQKYDLAITDCKKSLEIDPNYSKAYSRLGLTYSKMEIYDEAISCYKKALVLDPNNEGYKKNLQIAEEKQRIQELPQETANFPGMEGLGAMGNFLNNPMFMNMAKQIVQNPEMQEMAMKMMSGMVGSEGPGGASGSSSGQPQPDMSQILQMGQQFAQELSTNNPELIDQLRNQMPRADGDRPNDKDDSSNAS